MRDESLCRWCGEPIGTTDHGKVLCPSVKALEFDPLTGEVTRVEFIVPADFGSVRQEVAPEPPAGDYPRHTPSR